MARDCEAIRRRSSAGYSAWELITSGVLAPIAATNGSRSVPSSSARGAGIVTEVSSVFSVARPSPGKCLAVAPTRSRPCARVAAAVSSATSRPPPG